MFDIMHIPTRQIVRYGIDREEAVEYLNSHGDEYTAQPVW